jgi:hypothetical protein
MAISLNRNMGIAGVGLASSAVVGYVAVIFTVETLGRVMRIFAGTVGTQEDGALQLNKQTLAGSTDSVMQQQLTNEIAKLERKASSEKTYVSEHYVQAVALAVISFLGAVAATGCFGFIAYSYANYLFLGAAYPVVTQAAAAGVGSLVVSGVAGYIYTGRAGQHS